QQHHGMPTRLLDWTTNALAALFFAVSQDINKDKDGALYQLDAYNFAESQGVTDKFTGVLSSHEPLLYDFLDPIFEWRTPDDFPDYILPVLPDFSTYRIRFQRGCFTFHVPKRKGITKAENSTLKKFIIPKDRKEFIRNELYFLGIDEFQIYGDLENLSKRLKRAYKIC
ncbi:MAG: FRG domain-containing protein, partial [Saprospiraceae bacterium]